MSIWAKKSTKEELNRIFQESETMMKHLDMEVVEITDKSLSMKMPVDGRTKQPDGILHGGATAALAESIGSIASYLTLEGQKTMVGIDLNVSHLKAVHAGSITGTATPIRLGSTIQVWEIRVVNDAKELIAFSRFTVMVLNKPLQQK
jgi:uncharacterized protein (TIGR00369 family)